MGVGAPFFSIVLATVNRTEGFVPLLGSLRAQSFRDFELLVVDQNSDDRLLPSLSEFQDLSIRRLRIEPGLSRARNLGIREARGAVVYFCDDDQLFLSNTLATAHEVLEKHPEWGFVSGICLDSSGVPSVIRWHTDAAELTRANCWRRAVSISLFFRRGLALELGGFDERLGIGSNGPFQSGEESDLVLRALACSRGAHEPRIQVIHPQVAETFDLKAKQRAFHYGMGMGAVLRKNRLSLWDHFEKFYRPFFGAFIALLTLRWNRAQFYGMSLLGRIRGFTQWKN